MLGIGIDIVSVSRIEKLHDRYGAKLHQKMLSQEEGFTSVEHLAGVWAAKEAIVKAMGTGFSGFGPTAITIGKNSFGAPKAILSEQLQTICTERGIRDFMLSISHDAGVAVACAVAL